MAEIREVVIKITGEGGSSSEKKSSPKSSPKTNEKIQDVSTIDPATMVLLAQAFDTIKNEFISEVNYSINKHFSLTDDYITQRNLSVAKNVGGRVLAMGSTIIAGASVGGVPGAIIGAVVSMVQLGVDIYQNYDQANIQVKQQNAQLDFTRQRAGYSLTAGSVGEGK